ncbi:hypothetical protein ACEZDB_12875 [Streptacidiphilus sp. N1-3]|uniref:Uncharacterized protein n=1 Tax=Streptacidiphilus alkalitolerans TaxID=3342712 RepID=A0ABV6X025_9ACTN
MSFGEILAAIIGACAGAALMFAAELYLARREHNPIRLTVSQSGSPGVCVIRNEGLAKAHRVGISLGWLSPRDRPHLYVQLKEWREFPPGAEQQVSIPAESARPGTTIFVSYRVASRPQSQRILLSIPLDGADGVRPQPARSPEAQAQAPAPAKAGPTSA